MTTPPPTLLVGCEGTRDDNGTKSDDSDRFRTASSASFRQVVTFTRTLSTACKGPPTLIMRASITGTHLPEGSHSDDTQNSGRKDRERDEQACSGIGWTGEQRSSWGRKEEMPEAHWRKALRDSVERRRAALAAAVDGELAKP